MMGQTSTRKMIPLEVPPGGSFLIPLTKDGWYVKATESKEKPRENSK